MATINYPFWSQFFTGAAAGSFFGPMTRGQGSNISPPSPHTRETFIALGGNWQGVVYTLIQINSLGSFFNQRVVNGALVGSLITWTTEAQNTEMLDNNVVGIFQDDGVSYNWLDTNLAGAFDPIVVAGSHYTFNDNSFGFGDITP